MKQLLSLFLFLLPCLAWAQYPSNGNQKITLGEQTTADGLIYRGLAATDTVRKPSIDTMAYMVLDTTTNIMWHYKKATSNAWLRLNLLPSDTASFNYVNTYGTQTVNGAKTFTSALTATTFNPTALDSSTNKIYLAATNTLGFSTNGRERVRISETGSLLIGAKTDRAYTKLNVIGGATFQTNDFTSLFFNNTDNRGWGINMAFQDNNNDFGYIGSLGSLLGNTTKDMTIYATAGNGFRVYTNGNNKRLEITTTGAATFSSSVTATTGIFTNYAGGGTTGASLDNTGQIVRTSSIELKNNISNIKYGLNDILKINPISFNWKDENKYGNENENGFVAEDVYTIIPNVVSSDANGIFMDYTKLIPILTKAIQEQQAQIKALEQRIINLENK
jgi:hypothetical protein